MKHIGNFLVGTRFCLTVLAALPKAVNNAATTNPTVIDSIEALISMVSGLLLAFLVAWFKRKWEQKPALSMRIRGDRLWVNSGLSLG
jgi:hypothetical protein